MKKRFMVAALALMLTTACGSKPESTTTDIPGGGTVTTTQQGETTQVTVNGPGGQTTVNTTESGGGTTVKIEGVPGVGGVNVQGGADGGTVSVSGPGGSVNVQGGTAGGSVDVQGAGGTVDVQGSDAHGTVSVSGSEGNTTFSASDKVDESAFAVPFYPGATVVSGGQTETTGGDGKTMKIASAELTTKDPVDKVAAFYTEKATGVTKVDSTVDGKRTVVFAPANPMQGTTITVEQGDDGTRITMASQGG